MGSAERSELAATDPLSSPRPPSPPLPETYDRDRARVRRYTTDYIIIYTQQSLNREPYGQKEADLGPPLAVGVALPLPPHPWI